MVDVFFINLDDYYIWLVVTGTCFIFPYTRIGNNHPNWLSYFPEGLKPPRRYICVYTCIYIYIATHVHNEIQRHTLPWHREDKVSAIQNLVARDMGVPHLCQKRLGIYWILEPRTFPIWALIHFPQYYIPTYQTGSIHGKGRPLSPQWGTCQQTTLGPISTGESDLQVRDHRK